MRRDSVLWTVAFFVGIAAAGNAADWPQWRGPDRSGVVSRSPSLITTWPDKGPTNVWTSQKIADARTGGWSSVSVADGRAYVYLNAKYREPIKSRTLGQQGLQRLGWRPERMPTDLEKKTETARLSDQLRALRRWNDRKRWIQTWIENNLADDQRRWRGIIFDRLARGDKAIPFDVLDKLATIKGREFASQEELDKWFADNGIDGDLRTNIMQSRTIPDYEELANDVVLCFDAVDGKVLWKAELSGRAHGHPCSSTPTVSGGRCYVLGSNANIYCLDAATGKEIWKAKSKGNARSNDAASFAVIDGVAVLISGPISGFSTQTGQNLWTCDRRLAGHHNSPAYWRTGGKTYLVCNTDREVACVEPKTGKVLWRARGGGWSTAAVDGDIMVIFGAQQSTGVTAYKLSIEAAEKLWTVPFTDRGASPVIHDGYVYVIGGRGKAFAKCIDIKTGDVAWEQKLPGTEISSPIVADGKVIAVVGSGLYMFEATPEKYVELAKVPRLNIETCTSPAFVDGKLYLRLKNAVACYDLTR